MAAHLYEDPDIHERRWFLLGVMCLSLVLVVMGVSSLNVALPTIQESLDATATQLQWIVDAYAIVFAGLLLLAGALGDRFGRKQALLAGLVVFGLGATFAGLAGSPHLVIVGRAVQGVGAAFIMPSTLSIITVIFPPEERRRAIAVWAGFAGAAGAIGPLITGLLLEAFWWGSAFLVVVPVVVVAFVAIAVYAPRSRDDATTPLDPFGSALSLVGVASLVFGIIEGAERGWTDGLVLGAFALAAVMLGAFVAWERRAVHPMLPLELFRDRRFSVGSGTVTVAFFIMFGFFFMFQQWMQFARGYSALGAAVAVLPFAPVMIVIAPRSARLTERFGVGLVQSTGFLSVAAGFIVLRFVGLSTSYFVMVVALVLLGAGISVITAPATGNIMSAVPMSKAGVGSAVNDTTRELGGALGIAVLGSIVYSAYRSAIDLAGLNLDARATDAANESIGAAVRVASQTGENGGPLVERAAAAFTDAMHVGSLVAAVVAVAVAIVLRLTFDRRHEDAAVAAAAARAAQVPVPVPAE